jgi:phosphohistidine phosphatase
VSVEVILVRHAIAFERNRARWRDDRERPLTPKGKEKFRRIAKGLPKWLARPACLLTSPLVRARQTAEILTTVARWPRAIDRIELAPGVEPAELIAMLRAQRARRIALVGHEPALSTLLSVMIAGGRTSLAADLKKGGIVRVVFERTIRPGGGTLIALLPPRVLRRIG